MNFVCTLRHMNKWRLLLLNTSKYIAELPHERLSHKDLHTLIKQQQVSPSNEGMLAIVSAMKPFIIKHASIRMRAFNTSLDEQISVITLMIGKTISVTEWKPKSSIFSVLGRYIDIQLRYDISSVDGALKTTKTHIYTSPESDILPIAKETIADTPMFPAETIALMEMRLSEEDIDFMHKYISGYTIRSIVLGNNKKYTPTNRTLANETLLRIQDAYIAIQSTNAI